MGEIKSAWEKAMEKAELLGKPSEDELKRLEHIPTGNSIAAKFLNDEKYNFEAEMIKYKGSGIRQYVVQGALEVFLRNITLPHDDREKLLLTRAMAGIKLLKDNKKQLEIIFEQIKNLINYYEQARQHSFSQFKSNFEANIQETARRLQQVQGNPANIEAQLQQQFHDEWRRTSMELDTQYEKALEEQKQQILKLS